MDVVGTALVNVIQATSPQVWQDYILIDCLVLLHLTRLGLVQVYSVYGLILPLEKMLAGLASFSFFPAFMCLFLRTSAF